MTDKALSTHENWYANMDKTSLTDDARIKNITVLPPPEHLIRFFPISNTPIEKLIAQSRKKIRDIIDGSDDRLLVIIGPCSIHDPSAAVAGSVTVVSDALEMI
jgi:3-deoxy-7-phosphoheptulonate synthase